MLLTTEQVNYLIKISKETPGFCNGRCNYMITGTYGDKFGGVLDIIKLSKDIISPCNARYEVDKDDKVTLWFSSHNKYLPEKVLGYISTETDSVCYGANAWDNPANIVRYQNGQNTGFTSEFVSTDVTSFGLGDELFHYDLEVTIKDKETGKFFHVGGGFIDRDTCRKMFDTLNRNFAWMEEEYIRENFEKVFSLCETGREISGILSWSFSDKDIENLAKIHRDNPSLRPKVEELLEDCNFHTENRDFGNGEYDLYIEDRTVEM